MAHETVLIPIKEFSTAKSRLAPVLSPKERADLAKQLAASVVSAIGQDLEPVVISDSDDTRRWAKAQGIRVISCPLSGGLSEVMENARGLMGSERDSRITVLHSDLPLLSRFDGFAGRVPPDVAAITPDRRLSGTNMISLPSQMFHSPGLKFKFGPGSFYRFIGQLACDRAGFIVHRDPMIEFDLDTPEDLADYLAVGETIDGLVSTNS